jgi:hypothetical protein
MQDISKQPSRDEFIAYWKDVDVPFRLRDLKPHGIYIGGLALFAVLVRLISPSDSTLLLCAIVAVAYVILVPPVGIWMYQKKRVKFFRCPYCGDYFRRERHWEDVIWTGRCTNCKKQVLRDFAQDYAA